MEKYWEFNDDSKKIKGTYATLCIYTKKDINPDEITKILIVPPSKVQFKGEIINGKEKKWPSAWFLTSDGVIKSKDIRRHLEWIISKLSNKEEEIRNIIFDKGHAVFSIYWGMESSNGNILLDSEILEKLGKLGIGINIDIYSKI